MAGTDQDEHYTWKLIISDENENREEIAVNVTLHPPVRDLIELSYNRNYDVSISKTDLMTRFIGPVSIQLEPESSAHIETQALNHITISPTFNIREYVKNNVLIGSYKEGLDKSTLYETVGIGNAVSPSGNYPLDIAAGGNHLKMDNEGTLNFGKVILDSTTAFSDFTLADDELGLFIINFSISDSNFADHYTTILSRVARTGSADNIKFGTFTTDSAGYRVRCTGTGKIMIYNSKGEPQSGCYLKKIIKIMSY